MSCSIGFMWNVEENMIKSERPRIKILQKTLNFNCDFLNEGIRYLTFPVDFLKAETIVFHKSCNENSSISLLLGVKSLQNNEGLRS